MNILVAPSGFKESLEPEAAADCIETGILRVVPDAIIRKVPLFDGGEGFARGLVRATGGEHKRLTVTGPVRDPVSASYGFLGGIGPRTAVIEIAEAAGLRLVPKGRRDPTKTTSYGVGELIAASLDEGAERVLIGCGDSGTSDGGVGMCQALGARFLNRDGSELGRANGGESLKNLASIDLSGIHPRIKEVQINVLCNWKNILCGPKGVARVYGPQKGATAAQVDQLDTALGTYAAVVQATIGVSVAMMPGGGASGGLGTGFVLMGGTLRPRFEAIMEYFGIEELFGECDLVITAEGGIDYQTPQGKIPGEIALRAKKRGIPVIAIAGTIGTNATVNYSAGIDAFTSMVRGPTTLEDAVANAPVLLSESAESAMRMVMIGRHLGMRTDDTVHSGWLGGAERRKSLGIGGFKMQMPRPIFKLLFVLATFYVLISRPWIAANHY